MATRKKYKTDHSDPVVRKLEEVREALTLTQAEMADRLGVPFRTYQKWIYGAQRPRHGAALGARALALLAPQRVNCWDILKCGREPGGTKEHLEGPCPAAIDTSADGVNGGLHAGRICWAVSGTFCGRKVNGSEATRLISCLSCEFFTRVLREEGLANFKLLKPGQTYTQT